MFEEFKGGKTSQRSRLAALDREVRGMTGVVG